MQREDILKFLEDQCKALKEEHVGQLMEDGRIGKLKQIAQKLDRSLLKEFCKKERLELATFEIPEDCEYELVFYLCGSRIEDRKIFHNDKDFIKLLREKEEELANTISETMEMWNLGELTIEELLWGIPID